MTLNLCWMLLIIFGLVLGNLWLLRLNKKRQQVKPRKEIKQKKTTEGGVTGTIVAGSGTEVHKNKQLDTDHHNSSEGGSDGGGGTD